MAARPTKRPRKHDEKRVAVIADRISPKATTDLDKLIGAKLRRFRIEQGVSQERLADALGVTFQQVQKYENGMNRISVSRLAQVAKFLELPIVAFFEDLPDDPGGKLRKREVPLADRLFQTGQGMRLAEAFLKLEQPAVRAQIVNLVATLANMPDEQ